MKYIVDNIRKNALKQALIWLLPVIVLNAAFILMLIMAFVDGFDGEFLFLAAVSGFFAIPRLILFIKTVGILINPFKSKVFRKHGNANTIMPIML